MPCRDEPGLTLTDRVSRLDATGFPGLRSALRQRARLVDEHYGYALLDAILEPAGMTDQGFERIRHVLQIALALGTGQYLEEPRIEHGAYLQAISRRARSG